MTDYVTEQMMRGVPKEFAQHYAGLSNNVRALYATFAMPGTPRWFKWCVPPITWEERIEAWGQLCFDEAAWNAVAYHMYNKKMTLARFVSWRCEMDGEPVGGGKTFGWAPPDFDLLKYGPRKYDHVRHGH